MDYAKHLKILDAANTTWLSSLDVQILETWMLFNFLNISTLKSIS